MFAGVRADSHHLDTPPDPSLVPSMLPGTMVSTNDEAWIIEAKGIARRPRFRHGFHVWGHEMDMFHVCIDDCSWGLCKS